MQSMHTHNQEALAFMSNYFHQNPGFDKKLEKLAPNGELDDLRAALDATNESITLAKELEEVTP